MQQQPTRITVVSEGLLFEGFRTPRAFVWRETGVVPAARAGGTTKPAAAAVKFVLECLAHANLSKEDKSRCRRQVADMSAAQVQKLTAALRGFRRSSLPQ